MTLIKTNFYGAQKHPAEKLKGQKLTRTGQAIDIKRSIQLMAAGSLVDKAGYYYDDPFIIAGEKPIEEVQKMSKIERLEYGAWIREETAKQRALLQQQEPAGSPGSQETPTVEDPTPSE